MSSRRPRAHPTAVSDLLGSIIKQVDPDDQFRVYRLWTFWNDVVGPAIALRAQPSEFRDGVLIVAVATHPWMQELRFMKDSIRERLNARLGASLVQDIAFISGPVDAPPPALEDDAPDDAMVGPHLVALPPIARPELAHAFHRVVQARARRLARARMNPPSKGRRKR